MAAGLKTIIALSFVLAIGFLLVILSSALFHSYLTLLVVATYVVAPLPNWICGRCANPDDFMESAGSAVVDFGRFCTGFLVVMGVALPVLLEHSGMIAVPAMAMSIIGGRLVSNNLRPADPAMKPLGPQRWRGKPFAVSPGWRRASRTPPEVLAPVI